jgi:hypothetical protein
VADVNAFLNKEGDFSDENLAKILYKPDWEVFKPNALGIEAGFSNFYYAQKVLLGGKVMGDYAYFILGTQDTYNNRFVHIGVFPITYLGMNIDLLLLYVDSPNVTGSYNREETISGSEKLREFIYLYKGVGVLASMEYDKFDPIEIAALDDKGKAKMQFADLTDLAAKHLANRIRRLTGVPNLQTSEAGIGTGEGIYTTVNPLTATAIENLSFDPSKMTMAGSFYLRSK